MGAGQPGRSPHGVHEAEQAGADRSRVRRGRRREHVLADAGRAVPLAAGEQDHAGAGPAQLPDGIGSVCVAVLVGSGIRGCRGPVVAGVLERVGQPLLQLGGGVGERLGERLIQRRPQGGDPFARLALPRQHIAAQALDAQQQISPCRRPGRLPRRRSG